MFRLSNTCRGSSHPRGTRNAVVRTAWVLFRSLSFSAISRETNAFCRLLLNHSTVSAFKDTANVPAVYFATWRPICCHDHGGFFDRWISRDKWRGVEARFPDGRRSFIRDGESSVIFVAFGGLLRPAGPMACASGKAGSGRPAFP